MYADTGPAFRFMQGCSPETHQFDDLFKPYKLSDQTVCLFFLFSLIKVESFFCRCKDWIFNLYRKNSTLFFPFDIGFVIMESVTLFFFYKGVCILHNLTTNFCVCVPTIRFRVQNDFCLFFFVCTIMFHLDCNKEVRFAFSTPQEICWVFVP